MEMDTDYPLPEAEGPSAEPYSQVNAYLSYFDLDPSTFAFPSKTIETIETRRARMADRLLFDVVLHAGGLHDPADYFPPSNKDTLRELLKKIDGLKFDSLKRDCLVYSLLKWHRDGREKVFRDERCIPPQFSALSDAYWHLDAGVEVEKAVSILSDVRLNRDYTSKILQALSLDPSPYPLILRYVRTSKPLLTEPDDIERYTLALAESNISDAWNYQRTFPEGTREQAFPNMRSRLLRRIIWWCLEPTPRPKPLAHLLALPFTPYEHSLIKDIAFEVPFPPALADDPVNVRPDLSYRGTAILQTLLCTRYIHAGLFAKAIYLDAQFNIVPPTTSGHSQSKNDEDAAWAVVDERKQMISEIWSVLSGIERDEIEEDVKEMMKKSQGMNMAQQMQRKANAMRLTQLTLQKVSGVNGVANTTTNTTSSPNKASSPYTTPKKKAAAQYFTPHSAGSSSASKSFILGRARHSLGSSLANTPGTPGLLFTSPSSQTQTPQNRSQTQLNPSTLPLSSGPNPASPSPRSTGAGASASRAQTTTGGGGRRKSAGLGSGVAAPSSLFGQKAVPANQVKNAFYTPPAASAPDVAQTTGSTTTVNPANISTSASADRASPSGRGTGATNGKEGDRESRRQSVGNGDVEMADGEKDAEAGAGARSDGGDTVDNDHHDGATEPNSSQQTQKVHSITEDDDVPQFEHSVFVAPPAPKPVRVSASAAPSGSRRQSQTAQGPPRTRRALPKRSLPSVDKLIPGAFHDDTASPTSPVFQPQPQPQPAPIMEESAPAVATKSPTKVTTSRSAHARGTRRKIPGGFSVGSGDDDESEQEDEVAPLPPPLKKSRSSSRAVATTPGRKTSTRLSRSTKTRDEENEENESVILMRPTRRSSRLSAAGSVKGDDSGSEAGASPTKARTTRRSAKASGNESTSAGAAGTSATPRKKSTGRKKRVAEVTVQMARRS